MIRKLNQILFILKTEKSDRAHLLSAAFVVPLYFPAPRDWPIDRFLGCDITHFAFGFVHCSLRRGRC